MKSRSIPAFTLSAKFSRSVLILVLCFLPFSAAHAQTPAHYEPTLESLNQHPLPQWYADAKLGIFVHWGLYSVPGWAPLQHPNHDFTSLDYIKNNPYAEWYYDFAPVFDKETQKWNPDQMAKAFKDAGARYVVLTTKHHDGFTLWPSEVEN